MIPLRDACSRVRKILYPEKFPRKYQSNNSNHVNLLGIVYFNATHGCQNCTAVGIKRKRMSFAQTENPLRTDNSFRDRQHPEHHRTFSPLEKLPIDMIQDFIIADPLHLFDLGILKKLLVIWILGEITKDFKLSRDDKRNFDIRLLQCDSTLPSEFHRSIRSIEWLKFWKGTEYRTILMYIGIVVFKNIINNDAYKHFLYLFCAVTICSTDMYKKYVPLAKKLFDEFIELYIDLYGPDSITFNVHNLCHVTENVSRFGNLNSISTYPFENNARHIKLKLKQCNKSLEQVAKRIKELTLIEQNVDYKAADLNSKENYIFKFPIFDTYYANNTRYNYICIGKSVIISSKKQGDMWFLTKSNEIVQFEYTYMMNNKVILYGSQLKNKRNFFTQPFSSSFINVYESEALFDNHKNYVVDEIKCKMFCLSLDDKLVFVPLLHSFDVFN